MVKIMNIGKNKWNWLLLTKNSKDLPKVGRIENNWQICKSKKSKWRKLKKILAKNGQNFIKPENVSMLSEENVISLIMKRDDLAPFEFGHLRKERREHASDSSSQTRLEIVQNQFRQVRRRRVAAFRLFAQPNVAHFEMRWKQRCNFVWLRFSQIAQSIFQRSNFSQIASCAKFAIREFYNFEICAKFAIC